MKPHLQNLLDRKVETFDSLIIGEEATYFLLWNLSGKLVGYQRYIFDGVKQPNKEELKNQTRIKYKTYISEGEIGVFGLHTVDMQTKVLYLTEGVFDALMLHNRGLSAIALLGSTLKGYKSWLRTLPYFLVAICDNDKAGKKLGSYADISFTTPAKDLNDMDNSEIDSFLQSIKISLFTM